ncbi:MAG TPA: GNAT family N-acetyltransferase [Gemmatimonadaceae bacterium]
MNSQALNECFIAAMTRRCRYVPGSIVDDSAGLATLFTNMSLPSSYCVVSSPPRSREDFAARVRRAIDYGSRSHTPWSLVVLDDWLADGHGEIVEVHGLERHATVHGMWTAELSAPRRPAPSIDFRRVSNANELRQLGAINNLAHGFRPETGLVIYDHYVDAPDSHAFVGYVGDEAVTCAAAFPVAHGIYLGGVATIERHRGHGYGEAASRHALNAAREHTPDVPFILFADRRRAAFHEPLGFRSDAQLELYRFPNQRR